MKVRHPQYGLGVVRSIGQQTAEIEFSDMPRAVAPELAGLEPAEPQAHLSSLEMPLEQLLRKTAEALIDEMGFTRDDTIVEQLANRWRDGKIVLHSGGANPATKEISLDVLFHKIVMIRNNLRCLEQKINSHTVLTDADKFELQQYITRCYGSMTTFNFLFKEKKDQFVGTGERGL